MFMVSPPSRVTIYINGKEVEASVKQIRAEMNKLVNEQNRIVIGSDEYISHAKKIKELRQYLKEHAQSIGSAASAWTEMYNKVLQFGTGIGGIAQILSSLDNVTSTLKQVATDLAAMDDVYSDVIKTTGLTREQVEELNESFKNLDTRTSREQLNNLAYIAGKLGVDFFFAHPYHSWERGANENTNGLIRQYIPKGSSFENLTDDYIR